MYVVFLGLLINLVQSPYVRGSILITKLRGYEVTCIPTCALDTLHARLKLNSQELTLSCLCLTDEPDLRNNPSLPR